MLVVAPESAPAQSGPILAGLGFSELRITAGRQMAPLTLPEATGGAAPLAYSLEPLPDGLTFDGASRELAGSPADEGTTTATYTVTDAGGATDSLSFDIVVEADSVPAFDPPTVADLNLTVGEETATVTIAVTGGNGALAKDWSAEGRNAPASDPAAPLISGIPGLAFDTSTGELAGTPTAAGAYTASYSVTDTDGDEAVLSFDVYVNAAPSFGGATVADSLLIVGEAVELTLPGLGLGNGENRHHTYQWSPDLPAGLALDHSDPAALTLAGTPAGTAGAATYELTVSDYELNEHFGVDSDTLSVRFSVEDDISPSFAEARTAATLPAGAPGSHTLPALSLGNGPAGAHAHSWSPDLPAGLALDHSDPAAPTISGTATDGPGTSSHTLTVTDADHSGVDSATLDVDIILSPLVTLHLTPEAIDESGARNTSTVTAALSAASGSPTTITVSAEGDAATLGAGTELTIAAGDTASTGSVTLTAVDDEDADGDRLVTVSGSASNPDGVLGPAAATLTVLDDDGFAAALSGQSTTVDICGRTPEVRDEILAQTATDGDVCSAVDPAEMAAITVLDVADEGIASLKSGDFDGLSGLTDLLLSGNEIEELPDGIFSGLDSIEKIDVSGNELLTLAGAFDDLTTLTEILADGNVRPAPGIDSFYFHFDDDIDDLVNLTKLDMPVFRTPSLVVADSSDYVEFLLDVEESLDLPAAEFGDEPLTYDLNCWNSTARCTHGQYLLPRGLNFNSSQRRLRGTPIRLGHYNLRYIAADADPASASNLADIAVQSFQLRIVPLRFDVDVDVDDQEYTAGFAIDDLTLPAASGATGDASYSVTGLPDGLSFDAGTRTLSGTPTSTGSYDVTYQATYTGEDVPDYIDDTVELAFTILVSSPMVLATAPSLPTYTQRTAITPVTLPAASGGTGDVTYTLARESGAAVSTLGLSFDAGTRTLSGTPTRAGSFTVVYTATDENASTATLELTIEVAWAPDFVSRAVFGRVLSLPKGVAFAPLTLPEATHGVGTFSYSATGLPPGLAFDPSTRVLSGAPTAAGTYWVAYTATDENGAEASGSLNVVVASILVEAFYYDGGTKTKTTGLIPVAEGNQVQGTASYYTLQVEGSAGTTVDGDSAWLRIEVTEWTGDDDLEFFIPTQGTVVHDVIDNSWNFKSPDIFLFTHEDPDGVSGRATLVHTVDSNDPAYDGISFTLTLVEVENDPVIRLVADPATVDEDAGATTVNLKAEVVAPEAHPSNTTFSTDTDVTVTAEVGEGTATEDDDFTMQLPDPFTITVPANTTSKTETFTLTPVTDSLDEPDETVVLSGAATTAGAGEGRTVDPDIVTVTIGDVDPEPTLAISVGGSATFDGNVDEGAGGALTEVTFTVELTDADGDPIASGRDVTVDYEVSAGASGTATAGTDFLATSGTLTFPAGDTLRTVTAWVLDDADPEGLETFEFVLNNPTNAAFDAGGGTATVTIFDDDVPSLRIVGPSEAVEGAVAEFTVELSRPSGVAVEVDYFTSDPLAPVPRGVAAPSVDYTPLTGTFTFTPGTPGVTSKTARVDLLDDLVPEINETLIIYIAVDDDEMAVIDPGYGSLVVTILDNDVDGRGDEDTLILLEVDSDNPLISRPDTFMVNPLHEPDHGRAYLETTENGVPTGRVVYEPKQDFNGLDRFEYDAYDDDLGSVRRFTADVVVDPVNDGPTLLGGLENDSVPRAAGERRYEVIDQFEDVDNDELTYTAESSNPGVATARYENPVIVTPRSRGSTTITVRASDGQASSEFRFEVRVTDRAAQQQQQQTQTPEPDSVELTVDRKEVAEGGGPVEVTVTARLVGGISAQGVTVSVSVAGRCFVPVADFELVVPAGQVRHSAVFTLAPVDDRAAGPDETVTVSGEVSGADPLPVTPAVLTLADDDVPPTVLPELLAAGQVPRFVDVAEDAHSRAAVEALAARGVIRGYARGLFGPQEPLTRAQAAVLIVRARVMEDAAESTVSDAVAADVEPDAWYGPAVGLLNRLGVMPVGSDGLFRPNSYIPRAEMASLLVRAFPKLDPAPPGIGPSFADVQPDDPHAAAIEGISCAWVTRGCSSEPDRYCPTRHTTRSEMALFLARILGLADT